ncbi:hypothetical protein [uncultured Microscilla sp.]|uniref:hypothetical protein n=1 Tax=uncultured Microscilla sp. TaxID=432653 RepID=UPI0026175516|nr:hypothetical protein [uncultured Microscilla sp.]
MKHTIILIVMFFALGLCNISYGQSTTTHMKVVQFKKGTQGASYQDAVIRGERMVYVLGARKGQTMIVKVWAKEKNVVFQIRHRKTKKYLPDTEPGKGARTWTGALPYSGNYEVIVGGTRGNASYNISFTIM